MKNKSDAAVPARARWLRTVEAATLLGVSPRTIRLWSDLGHIEAHRTPGGHRRFEESQLRQTMQSSKPVTPCRVLLVDSNGPRVRQVAMLLSQSCADRRRKMIITVAESGWMALLEVAKRAPDIIVIDVNLAIDRKFDFFDAVLCDPEIARHVRLIAISEHRVTHTLPKAVAVVRRPLYAERIVSRIMRDF